tara:strand:- start:3122 stop:3523 length:402 start_codon:yes stop_codon:yes gene_type:complete
MKAGDKIKANTLRTVLAKLKDKQINSRKDLSEQEELNVIKTLVKQRKESYEIFTKAGRVDLAKKEDSELNILNNYLPNMMSEDNIKILVQNVISETKASSLADIGKVMPLVMKKGKGKIDGKIANVILRDLLE